MQPARCKRLLFLCSGNYYRSRFAEIYFNWQARDRGMGWQSFSRGLELCAGNIGPISRHAYERLVALGIHTDELVRLPEAAQECDFGNADHVIAVKGTEHRPMIRRKFPTWYDRIEFWEIHDLDCAPADEALASLEQQLRGLIDRLAAQAAA